MDPELIAAISNNDLDAIRKLIESNPDLINQQDKDGDTPLHLALQTEKMSREVITYLLEKSAKADILNAAGDSALKLAVKKEMISIKNSINKEGVPSALPTAEQSTVALILSKSKIKPNPFQISTNYDPDWALDLAYTYHLWNEKDMLEKYQQAYLETASEAEIKQFAELQKGREQRNYIKKKGHALGISDMILFLNPIAGKNATVHTEGFEDKYSIENLHSYLKDYLNQLPKLSEHKARGKGEARESKAAVEEKSNLIKHLTEINEAVTALSEYTNLKDAEKSSPKYLLDRIKQNKLTILTGSWADHAFSIAIMGDFLIVSNRGSGRAATEHGSEIYRLTETEKKLITEDFIRSIADNSETKKDLILKRLKTITKPENFIEEIESQDQKHGTCSFVNHKSMIRSLLYLMECQSQASKLGRALSKTEKDQAASFAKQHYKEFTQWMRDEEIDDIVKAYKEETVSKTILEQLIKSYIDEHFLKSPSKNAAKTKEDILRALKLLSLLNDNNRKEMLLDFLKRGVKLFEYAVRYNQESAVNFFLKNNYFAMAIENGSFSDIEYCLKAHVDVNATDSEGHSIVQSALTNYKAYKNLDYLYENGFDLFKLIKQDRELLRQLISNDCNTLLEKMVQDPRFESDWVNEKDSNGNSILAMAVANNNIGLAKTLLEKGAEIDTVNKRGTTPLMNAAKKSLNLVKLLLEHCKEEKRAELINKVNSTGNTSLMIAIDSDSKEKNEIFKYLIENGADTSIKNKYGWSALEILEQRKALDLMKFIPKKDEHRKDEPSPLTFGFDSSLDSRLPLLERSPNIASPTQPPKKR